MSLRDQFSPKTLRAKKGESQEVKLEETRLDSVQPNKPELIDTTADLIDRYAYKPETDGSKIAQYSAQKEPTQTFGLFDLSFFCEEHLAQIFAGPIELHQLKVYNLQKEYIKKKMRVYSEIEEEIQIGLFKDTLWKYNDEYFIPEEYYKASGFLREFFDIKELYVLYNTGEIIYKKTKWFSFWSKDFLENPSLDREPLIDNDIKCLSCNFTCPYRKRKQNN